MSTESGERPKLDPEIEARIMGQVLDALQELPQTMAKLRVEPDAPTDSPFLRERERWKGSKAESIILESLAIRYPQALLAAEDALVSLSRALRPPPSQIAQGGIARDILESCAVALWLCDPNCDPQERLERHVLLWRHELIEGQKLKNRQRLDVPVDEEAFWDSTVQLTKSWVSYVEGLLVEIGVEPKKKRPTAVELTDSMLGAAHEYRLWSNVSHGNPFVTANLRRMHATGEATRASIYPIGVSVDAYARALVATLRFAQPGLLATATERLHAFYDRMGIDLSRERGVRSFLDL